MDRDEYSNEPESHHSYVFSPQNAPRRNPLRYNRRQVGNQAHTLANCKPLEATYTDYVQAFGQIYRTCLDLHSKPKSHLAQTCKSLLYMISAIVISTQTCSFIVATQSITWRNAALSTSVIGTGELHEVVGCYSGVRAEGAAIIISQICNSLLDHYACPTYLPRSSKICLPRHPEVHVSPID